MRYHEKLLKQVLLKGLNGQKLARLSKVSDSEISRILGGKSQPGLENAFRLARAVGVSLDYLADDTLEADPSHALGPTTDVERDLLNLGQQLGQENAHRLLYAAHVLGYDVAIRRIYGAESKPLIEVGDGSQPARAVHSEISVGQVSSA